MSVLNTMLRDLERRGVPAPQSLPGRDPAWTATAAAIPSRSRHPWRRPLALTALLLATGATAAALWFAQHPKPEQAAGDRHASQPTVQAAAPAPVAAPVDTAPPRPTTVDPTAWVAVPQVAVAPAPSQPAPVIATLTPGPSPTGAGEGRNSSPTSKTTAGSSSSPAPQTGERSSSSPASQTGEGSRSSPLPLAGEGPGVRVPSSQADAPAVSQSAAQSELTRAIGLVGRGRTTEATQVLLAALNKRPDWVDARSMLAALQAEAGDRREALSTLLAGVATDPARFAPTAAQLQAELEDPAGALQTLDRVPAAARDRPYHALAAAIAQHAGQHELAVAEYAAALRFDPADSVAWVGLGISLQALGRGEQALAAFRGAAQGPLSADLRRFVEARIRQLPFPAPGGATQGPPAATRP